MSFDGIRIADEVAPVEGFNPTQVTRGVQLKNTIEDKLLNIPNELIIGKFVDWSASKSLSVRNMRVNIGVPPVGGNVVFQIRKNNTPIGTLTVNAGVMVQVFPASELSETTFNESDSFSVYVLSTSASTPAYHLTFQLDYKVR
jgi:hypothetical protein